jgi:FkbM family methyltransferase
MINFSGINTGSIAGKCLRAGLSVLPDGLVVPVLQGPIRGYRWIVGSSNHGCWLGSFELEKQHMFRSLATVGAVIYDIGANVGVYTLLGSKLVGHAGHVYAFEPLPRNIRLLKKHLRMNNLRNVTAIEKAISDCDGFAAFRVEDDNSAGSLSSPGDLTVETMTLDRAFLEMPLRPPSALKIDVEGAETRVLAGAKTLLATYRPAILLATHGYDQHHDCCEILRSAGYELSSITGGDAAESDELLAVPARA